MSAQKIEKLQELLSDFLGPGKTIVDHETTRLTAVGENYGSTMLSVRVQVKDKERKEDKVELVAKLPPPGEFIQRMFNSPITFRNEINFYKLILPELENFAKERGISDDLDCYPRFYGGRLSLSDKDYADDDAVLLLENLKVEGYTVVDRTVGFDFHTAQIVLKALAKFHAVFLALKLQKSEEFNKKIKPIFSPYVVFEMEDEMMGAVRDKIKKLVEGLQECKIHANKVEQALKSSCQFTLPRNSPDYMREPFSTILHTDAWVNNFMVKFIDGEPIDCKIVDFQLAEYGSPARDVIFFIFSSVQIPVVQKHYDQLIGFYHKNLIKILKMFGCDTKPFSIEELHKEIRQVSRECEFFHCMVMLEPIFATKDDVKELDEYKEEDMIQVKEVSPKHKEKAAFIVKEFVKRNLI